MSPRLALALVAASAALAQPGVKPPAAAADYRANAAGENFEIGARLLSAGEARSTFSTPVDRGYLVVEVALYPSSGIDVRLADFALRAGGSSGALLRPVAARIVAGAIAGRSQRARNVELYPAVGVGYGTYGGWSTSAGVGVGIGSGYPPGAGDGDLRTMEAELGEQALPEGMSTQPVAGYLYFAAPKRRTVTFDLEYRPGSERLTLPLITR